MNHKPFDSWILEGYSGTPVEKEQFEEHLSVCPQCLKLEKSWNIARHQLRSAPVKKAPSKFVEQWQSNLVRFKEKQKRKQARTLLVGYIGGALVALIALSAVLLPKISLISVIVTATSAMVRIIESIKQVWTIILSLVKVAPTTTILVIAAMIAGWILLAALAWAVSVWKVSVKKVVAK